MSIKATKDDGIFVCRARSLRKAVVIPSEFFRLPPPGPGDDGVVPSDGLILRIVGDEQPAKAKGFPGVRAVR